MKTKTAPLVSIIMGSDSDLRVMQDAADILESLGVAYEITIVSAHRTPDRLFNYAKEAEDRGLKAIIAGAGGAAHLPGMVASLTLLPVIGVPIAATKLNGEDALLSIVQMPKGIPVATVAIGSAGAINSAYLAAQMLGIESAEIQAALLKVRQDGIEAIKESNKKLENS